MLAGSLQDGAGRILTAQGQVDPCGPVLGGSERPKLGGSGESKTRQIPDVKDKMYSVQESFVVSG